MEQRKECLLFKTADLGTDRSVAVSVSLSLSLSLSLCVRDLLFLSDTCFAYFREGDVPLNGPCVRILPVEVGEWEREVTDILIPGTILTNHTH